MVTRFPVNEVISGGCLVGGGQGYNTHLANASMESPWLLSSCASGRGNAGCDRPAGFMMACAAAG